MLICYLAGNVAPMVSSAQASACAACMKLSGLPVPVGVHSVKHLVAQGFAG
jgi:hypothetical protein